MRNPSQLDSFTFTLSRVYLLARICLFVCLSVCPRSCTVCACAACTAKSHHAIPGLVDAQLTQAFAAGWGGTSVSLTTHCRRMRSCLRSSSPQLRRKRRGTTSLAESLHRGRCCRRSLPHRLCCARSGTDLAREFTRPSRGFESCGTRCDPHFLEGGRYVVWTV